MDEKNQIVKALRACLISIKGMISLKQLEKDYNIMIGEKIPYARLGVRNLEELIRSDPSFIINSIKGELFVDAQVSEKSAHISNLVYNQKQNKSKVGFKVNRNSTNNYIPPPRMTQTTKWRPKSVLRDTHKYQRSSRPAAVSHNQFISTPTVPSKVVRQDSSGLYDKQNNQVPAKIAQGKQVKQSFSKKNEVSSRLNVNGGTVAVKTSKSIHPHQTGSAANHGVPVSERCSSLVNTKRTITKKMSEIGVERDSGNSSPTELAVNNVDMYPVIPKIPELTGDPLKDLKNLVEFYKLGEIKYDIKPLQKHLLTCILKVENKMYYSYPNDFVDPNDAKNYCAEQALKELRLKYNKNRSLLLTNDRDILERIPPMLEKHAHGIWDWQLKLDYTDKYNEELPKDWLKIIDKSPSVQLEKYMDNYVVRHCKPGDRNAIRNTAMALTAVSVPSNTVQFGEDGRLYAEVTCVLSANEIWCRQNSTEETNLYEEMNGRMQVYYQQFGNELKVETITMGAYYVTKYDDAWYRVRTIQEEKSNILCFFIDFGDELAVLRQDVYQLKREYASAQSQAFVCRLVGLEDLYEFSQTSEKMQAILYSSVLLELATDATNIDGDVTLPVYMYNPETGESINENMITLLSVESATPEILKDTIIEVYISNIESNGDVYVQLHSSGYKRLQTLLKKLEEDVLTNPRPNLNVPIKKEESNKRLYLAKRKADGRWCRIQLIDWSPCQTLAQIYFVDYGNTDVIQVNKDIIYPLASLSDILNSYPFQAVKVKMAINEIPEDFIHLAKKAMPETQPILLKVIKYDNACVPLAEFFKRNFDGGLFCINKSISMELEMKKGDTNNNIRRRNKTSFDSKNVPSSGKLDSPELPNKGDYFEVHVPFAVNPYNFFVQPLKTLKDLNKIMEKLQERYKDVQFSPLTVDQVIPGNIYASKHDDGNWYRTSVIKVIHSGSISVYYCDFGYYNNLTVQQLIPLDIEFVQLPYQALKAKLANIKPKKSQWTMDDCDSFKAMVERKNFYSILSEIERDQLYEEDLILSLTLIDTSSPADVLIGDELIQKGVAVSSK